ncbi:MULTISPECIES: DsrE family protein [Sphingobium]|uniref:Peroxiredoxin n=1 Tax=Sphingobium fuliginis (strain ATCC 27551) TaxID=336203 RepID=A0ABQ1EMX9_SPHSA|nr:MULTISPECIES: DsrE family protein [Sphingobium]AJR22670.1 peroxiredoxin [Sphingobium sp. YBL2]MCB4862519.1 DsrE family protein [Sphingobium sp. PNB]PNP98748.1 peroxiredoxin [Sphingobium sp. SA916]RYM01043.1 peroxiredoxin [Sphingobium fuliginis]WDA38597.1 DsrE family protein [Sphingobium sp. YC-XJ3]
MRELRIIVATADAERLRGALVIAAAQAALGGGAALFLQLDAVSLLRAPPEAPCDEAHRASGLPSLAMVIEEALGLGVILLACQSGLALCGMTADDLPQGVEVGGPMGFLQQTGEEARLIFA